MNPRAVALVVPPTYLALSIKYWFRSPTTGIALATLCVWVGLLGTGASSW